MLKHWTIDCDLVFAGSDPIMRSAHHLIMVITCVETFQNVFSVVKVMEQTRNVDFLTLDH
jgi:hypothetical protein